MCRVAVAGAGRSRRLEAAGAAAARIEELDPEVLRRPPSGGARLDPGQPKEEDGACDRRAPSYNSDAPSTTAHKGEQAAARTGASSVADQLLELRVVAVGVVGEDVEGVV